MTFCYVRLRDKKTHNTCIFCENKITITDYCNHISATLVPIALSKFKKTCQKIFPQLPFV